MDSSGRVIEKVQTKFVGANAKACLAKLASPDYDKYFNDGKVDKIEIPQEYFDEIRRMDLIGQNIHSLKTQLESVKLLGKEDVVKMLENRIDRFKKIDQMIDRSTISQKEAIEAIINPNEAFEKILDSIFR